MRFVNSKRARRASLVCFAAATSLLGYAAHGATIYSWAAASTGSWDDSTQWVPNTGSPVAGDTAIFNAAGVNGNEIIYLDQTTARAGQSVGTVIFANTGSTTLQGGTVATPTFNILTLSGGGGITVNSGAGTVSIGGSGGIGSIEVNVIGDQSIVNNSSNSLIFTNYTAGFATGVNTITYDGTGTISTGTISDSTTGSPTGSKIGIVKNGAGTLALVNNGFSGGSTINAGTVLVGSANSFGTAAQLLTINGGTLAATGSARSIPANVSVAVSGNFGLGGQGQALTFLGPINLGNTVSTMTTLNSVTLGGVITTSAPTGGFIKAGTAGTATLSVASTYSGETGVTGGTLTVSSSSTDFLSPNSDFVIGSSGILNIAGYSQVIGSLSDGGGAGGHLYIGNGAAGLVTTGGDGNSTTFSGSIGGSTAPGNTGTGGGLTKTGTGQFTLTGSNGYAGPTTVTGGILQLANPSHPALAFTSSVTVNPNGELLLGASNQINAAATVSFAGGTFNTGGNSEGSAGSPGLGAATVTASSIIDMGSGSSVLAFANSSASTWTGSTNLDIYDWSGTPVTGGGTDQLFFGTDATGLTSAQLAEIRFFSDAGSTQYAGATTILSDGEVVPGAVPEPASLSLLAIGALGLIRRRRAR